MEDCKHALELVGDYWSGLWELTNVGAVVFRRKGLIETET